MQKWYLPTLSEVIASSKTPQVNQPQVGAQQRVRAEREWFGAIAALNSLLQEGTVDVTVEGNNADDSVQGLILSGPLPVIDQPDLVSNFSTWTFTTKPQGAATLMPFQLLPAAGKPSKQGHPTASTLPLMVDDPLATEQFCLTLTPDFSLVMVLGDDADGNPAFLFSFEPEVVWQSWRSLQSRLVFNHPQAFRYLEQLVKQFAPVTPDFRTVMQFSQLMLANLPEPQDWAINPKPSRPGGNAAATSAAMTEPDGLTAMSHLDESDSLAQVTSELNETGRLEPESWEKLSQAKTSADTELLKAIAHEVRTPLTTIRTLTRLLMKRKDLSPDVIKRLGIIDRECTEQIDRFSLIFRAVEIETASVKHPLSPLAATSLAQVFQQSVPRWQEQASQRGLTLDVILPQKMPLVVSDPTMLNQVLTGLIDQITHTLTPGSHIQVHVMLAGHQLKLQLESHPKRDGENCSTQEDLKAHSNGLPSLKSVGRLLMFQPETGSLSLNMAVTKNLFQALGGKLIVRQRPEQGEILTIFLPLEAR